MTQVWICTLGAVDVWGIVFAVEVVLWRFGQSALDVGTDDEQTEFSKPDLELHLVVR